MSLTKDVGIISEADWKLIQMKGEIDYLRRLRAHVLSPRPERRTTEPGPLAFAISARMCRHFCPELGTAAPTRTIAEMIQDVITAECEALSAGT